MAKKYGLLLILLFCLPLFACFGADSLETTVQNQLTEPDQPEIIQAATNEPEPAQSLDIPVTGVDQIVGTWIAAADLGNFVVTIFPDGKFSVATSVVDLEAGSTDSWKLTIEDGQISATGFALCLGDTGTYLAVLNADGTLKFTSILDACDARLRKMDRSLPGRLNPYNLIYHRVE